jgi:hypothetical protein
MSTQLSQFLPAGFTCDQGLTRASACEYHAFGAHIVLRGPLDTRPDTDLHIDLYGQDIEDALTLAEAMEHVADGLRGLHEEATTAEAEALSGEVVAAVEALEGAVDEVLAAAEVAPHEDTAATGHLGEEVA